MSKSHSSNYLVLPSIKITKPLQNSLFSNSSEDKFSSFQSQSTSSATTQSPSPSWENSKSEVNILFGISEERKPKEIASHEDKRVIHGTPISARQRRRLQAKKERESTQVNTSNASLIFYPSRLFKMPSSTVSHTMLVSNVKNVTDANQIFYSNDSDETLSMTVCNTTKEHKNTKLSISEANQTFNSNHSDETFSMNVSNTKSASSAKNNKYVRFHESVIRKHKEKSQDTMVKNIVNQLIAQNVSEKKILEAAPIINMAPRLYFSRLRASEMYEINQITNSALEAENQIAASVATSVQEVVESVDSSSSCIQRKK